VRKKVNVGDVNLFLVGQFKSVIFNLVRLPLQGVDLIKLVLFVCVVSTK
jgi:hypothetical protein